MNRSSSCVFDMDLPQLEMFLAVAEEGSFTRAGERLHVSQSAVSRQIGLLERELGGRLFHRDGRRSSLTHEAVENFLREEKVSFEVAMETENAEIIKAMVANGNGITVLSHATVAADLRHRRLAFARLRGRKVYRETGWVHLKSDYVPRAVTEMLRLFEGMRTEFASKL